MGHRGILFIHDASVLVVESSEMRDSENVGASCNQKRHFNDFTMA